MKIHGNKTYIAVLAGILTVVGTYLGGDATIAESVQQILMLLGIAGVRHGIKTGA